MKTMNVTFSLLRNMIALLCMLVEKRQLSRFVAKALGRALEEEKEHLKEAYAEANSDPDRQSIIADWERLDSEDWDGRFSAPWRCLLG